MRHFLVLVSILSLAACGAVDDQPLGGPNGGTTDPTDPNGGQGDTTNPDGSTTTTDDAGTTTTKDSGTTQQKDSGTTTKDASVTVDSGGGSTSITWTYIFNTYMGSSEDGRCASCHSQGSTAAKLYSWLSGKGYINGTKSALVSTSQSCLSWYGGNMPPSGPSDAKAVSDMNAWAASGAPNN